MFQTFEIGIRISQKRFKYTLKECYADAYVKFFYFIQFMQNDI
jgi:hypothetical protein